MLWKDSHPRRLPTPDELQDSCSKICDADVQITALTSQINALQKLLEDIKRDRELRASFIAPFRRLPPEIIGEIALHCIHAGSPGPQILNQVSVSMRITINSTKALWSKIWTNSKKGRTPIPPDSIACFNPKYLEIVLGRATPMPLNITFRRSITRDVAAILSTFSRYFDTIVLEEGEFRDDERMRWGLDYPKLDLVALQSLNLGGEMKPPNSFTYDLLAMATTSQKSTFRLTITNWDHDDIFNLLKHDSLRQVTTLEVDIDDREVPELDETNSLPRLKELIIRGSGVGILDLHMPNLQSLSILYRGWWSGRANLGFSSKITSLDHLFLASTDIGRYTSTNRPKSYEFTRLSRLTMVECTIVLDDWPCLTLNHLEELTLSEMDIERSTCIEYIPILDNDSIFGHLPSLKRLWMDKLSTPWARDFRNCSNLLALRVTRCKFLLDTLESISCDMGILPRLEELVIRQDPLLISLHNLSICRPILKVCTNEDKRSQHPFEVGLLATLWQDDGPDSPIIGTKVLS